MKGRDFSGIEKHVDGQPRNNGQDSFSGEVKRAVEHRQDLFADIAEQIQLTDKQRIPSSKEILQLRGRNESEKEKADSRIFPPFVVNAILPGARLVALIFLLWVF